MGEFRSQHLEVLFLIVLERNNLMKKLSLDLDNLFLDKYTLIFQDNDILHVCSHNNRLFFGS